MTTGHHTKTTVQPCIIMLLNNMLLPPLTTWKIHYCPPEKNPSNAQARLYVDQVYLKLFAHVPLSIKSIMLPHPIYAGATIQLYKQDHGFQFLMDQMNVEVELEPKTLDAWRQGRSFEITVPASQPCFRLL